jgi:hypothetical protein
LTNWGKSLTAKEWRTFQQQFETAADRVLDKGEREAYDLLFDQLSGYWQEKVVKEERTQKGNKFWVRFGTVRGLKRRELMEILESADVKYESIKEQSNGFLVKCEDEREAQQAIDLDGALVGTQTLRVTRSVLPLTPKAIFDLVHEQLKIKEEAQTRGKRTEGHRRVHQTEQEKKVEKVEKVPDTPVAKPLAQFRPSSSSRPQRSGPPANHYAGFPGSGAPASSNPRHNPNWSPGPQNAQWNAAPNRSYANPPSGGKGKGGGKGHSGSQGGNGNTQFVSSTITPAAIPIVTPIQTLSATTLPNLPPGIKCIACKLAKQPYEHNYMTCPLFWESEEAKKFQA